MRPTKEMGIVNNRATEASRGCHASRWQLEPILSRGYTLATVYYGDREPDFSEGWKRGLRAALSPRGASTVFAPDDWGAIGAWAWGLSRALDYLEREPAVDARRVAVIGHSRRSRRARCMWPARRRICGPTRAASFWRPNTPSRSIASSGAAGLGVEDQPPPDQPVGDFIGYHLRTGDHDVTAWDWEQYLNFADRHFKHGPAAKKSASANSAKTSARARPIKLLTRQRADGEFPGWRSFHESPATRTADVWRLQRDGVLVCKGTPRGYLYTERDYTDFAIEFDWRWPAGATDSNGGMLVRMTGAHGIWPRCLEFQINLGQAGDFSAIRGYEFSGPAERLQTIAHDTFGPLRHLKRVADAVRPVGEWNHYEAVVDGGTVTLKINGVLVNQATGCEAVPGKILLTADGQEIHFRNVRLTARR
jgi:hypothetical protein